MEILLLSNKSNGRINYLMQTQYLTDTESLIISKPHSTLVSSVFTKKTLMISSMSPETQSMINTTHKMKLIKESATGL